MVGIDIGSKTIKIVELEKAGTGHNLLASGIVGVTGTPIDKLVDEKEIAVFAQIIKKLHKEAGISTRDVAISLPESSCFTRTIKYPLLTDTEIASAIKWESEQYIPIPVEEAVIQHSVLSRVETGANLGVTVLLVAAPKTVVQKYVGVIEAAGLSTIVVETELIALTRALAPVDKTVMLVDFGAASTDIAIADHGLLSFSRSIAIAGETFTRSVSQKLGMNEIQAEEYKKTYGFRSNQLEGKIKGALDPVLSMVIDEIKKAIHYYQTEEKGEAPNSIIISGGSSGMPEIINSLTSLLGIEVSIANPFAKISMEKATLDKLAPYSPLYSVAIGLALRDEN